MNNGELTEEQLKEIKAGISSMNREQLEALKEQLTAQRSGELDMDSLDNVRGGSPYDYDDAKNYFDENVKGGR